MKKETPIFLLAIVIIMFYALFLHKEEYQYALNNKGYVVEYESTDYSKMKITFEDGFVVNIDAVIAMEDTPLIGKMFSEKVYSELPSDRFYAYVYSNSDGRLVFSTVEISQKLLNVLFRFPTMLVPLFLFALSFLFYLFFVRRRQKREVRY